MPKMKTRKSAVKRLRQTGTGKIMFRHTHQSHAMISKSPGRRRRLYMEGTMHPSRRKMVSRQLPYGAP